METMEGCDSALADRVFAAVNRDDIPLNFLGSDLGDGIRFLGPTMEPIRHREFADSRVSINTTADGHMFHPGQVVHTVQFRNGGLRYSVIGSGSGSSPNFNNLMGLVLFSPGVENKIRRFGIFE